MAFGVPETHKMSGLSREQVDVLLKRYELLRQELQMRFEARHKILAFGVTALVALMITVLKTKIFALGFAGCLCVLGLGLLLLNDLLGIRDLANYLAEIDEELDRECQIPVTGWESHAKSNFEARRGYWWIQVGAASLTFLVFYTLFNVVGCSAIQGSLAAYAIGFLVEVPALGAVAFGGHLFRRFREPGRATASMATASGENGEE